ncbi:MAG TPA: coproporphyrinogen dehydrogenase HemZ [Desulfitobacterium dehalogenans]|uniref:Coproporphyrinogen dehydrogenase HemZ n=1 Tax=Desulfitobacterium dehalogenans TaxID=36854 RepID=A0A7C7D571_9FIRM|nr:coproporphyrinogen dehydrogenase HemZ [Desulfitobacterium dehalogenans]
MRIILKSNTLSRSELEAGLSLSRAFFPEARVEFEEEDNHQSTVSTNLSRENDAVNDELGILHIDIHYPDAPWRIEGYFNCKTGSNFTEVSITLNEEQIKFLLSHPYVGKEGKRKLLLKRGLFALLSQRTGHTPPWGILTGIRPSKILHRLNEAGYPLEDRERSLREVYAIREDKAQLLQEVVSIQQPFLETMKNHPKDVAVYIGIPFCPTRCSYCSFPAYSLKQSREPLEHYLQGLGEEIRATGEWMRTAGLAADSLYLGGGTPTILTIAEIRRLIALMMIHIPHKEALEFTVEAGRPDTLFQEKLLALRASGVNRLSINPQTMHNRTLQRIGRAHTVEDILKVYGLAREIPGWIINMDLIIGLPEEGVRDIQETLEQIKALEPDNLTVHALAIKRGSKVHEQGLTQNLGRELEAMQEVVMAAARSMGMQPYYLYRQKQIAGNLENIGFTKPGLECRYNIGIMEEHQTVIGLGAGASSKIVNLEDFSLVSFHHPANWQVYLERWGDTQRKRAEAQRILG